MILRVIRRKPSLWTKVHRELSSGELAQLSPEAIINEKAKDSCLKRLKRVQITMNDEINSNKAAVLIPLCIHNGKLGILYTLRSTKVSMNRGQVSFPGGMKDENDATLEETALRETWEELRLPKDSVVVWGCGNMISRKHVTVLPVLGFVGEIDPTKLKVNTHEVEEAFVHPLEKLCDPTLCRHTQFRSNYTLPVYLGGNHKIWGLTAAITHVVMNAIAPGVYKHKLPYLKPIDINKENPITNDAKKS